MSRRLGAILAILGGGIAIALSIEVIVDGGERYVDLGEVNGRVFVNTVARSAP
jgi:hypothetical protein